MNSSRIAVIAASVCAIGWAAKAVAIGLAGGLDKSPAEGPLFLLGLALAVVTLVAMTLTATSGRPTWQRVAAPPASLAALVGGVALLQATIGAASTSDHWAWYELNLWIVAAVLLGLALRLDRRRAAHAPMHAPAPVGYASR